MRLYKARAVIIHASSTMARETQFPGQTKVGKEYRDSIII